MYHATTENLLNRRRAHDLRDQGLKLFQIQDAMAPLGRSTVRQYLTKPRPTDQELQEAEAYHSVNQIDTTGQVSFKARFPPDLFDSLRHEAELQQVKMNKTLICALKLYLDCQRRLRTGSAEPVQLLGYRP